MERYFHCFELFSFVLDTRFPLLCRLIHGYTDPIMCPVFLLQPIPYWLYKLHGLNISYSCEICGNFTYRYEQHTLQFAKQKSLSLELFSFHFFIRNLLLSL